MYVLLENIGYEIMGWFRIVFEGGGWIELVILIDVK